MAISPMLRGLRSGFGKLAVVSGFALILVMFALPTFALTGDQPAAVDTAVAADPQTSSASVAPAPKPTGMAFMHQDYLLNWGPERGRLADKGFSFDFHYITDAIGDPRHPAGVDEMFINWQRIRGTINVDFGKFTAAKGFSMFATGVWQNGTNLGGVIGSLANPSGIVSNHQFRLDSLTFSQMFVDNKVKVTFGLMAAQDNYGLQEYGGAFVNESQDYNFGNQGNTRMSYDPQSGPGADIKVMPNKYFYVKSGFFMPSDDGEQHPYPTGFNYRNGHRGGTWDTEFAYFTDPGAPDTRKSYPGIIKAGFVYNGSQAGKCSDTLGCSGFPDFSAKKYVDNNYSFYVQANQPVYRVQAGCNRGLDVTLGVSTGPTNKSAHPTQFTGGLIFNGPIASRDKDSVAFGWVQTVYGNDYKNKHRFITYVPGTGDTIQATQTGFNMNDENMYEINYKAQIAPWLLWQPVYQYYANVGGREHGSAGVLGFRLVAHF